MMKVKELKEFLNKLDPSLDEAPVVQDSGDHNYCGIGFEVTHAELHNFGSQMSEYHGDRHMQPGSVKVKVLRVG